MSVRDYALYLDYCSELLSLTSKAAALCAEESTDALVLDTVSEIENLTTGMSRKIWQKISLLREAPRHLSGLPIERALRPGAPDRERTRRDRRHSVCRIGRRLRMPCGRPRARAVSGPGGSTPRRPGFSSPIVVASPVTGEHRRLGRRA